MGIVLLLFLNLFDLFLRIFIVVNIRSILIVAHIYHLKIPKKQIFCRTLIDIVYELSSSYYDNESESFSREVFDALLWRLYYYQAH